MKIGIIGSESSHAEAFGGILRGMGHDAVIDDSLTPTSLAAFDGVMLTARRGNLRERQAVPWIEAGVPLWIDKPFARDVAQAEAILRAAKTRGVCVTGGSACKFAPGVLSCADRVKNGAFGNVRSAMLNFPIALDSPYDGIHFYAHHLAELTLTALGYEMRAVRAFEKNGGLVCLARYDHFDAVMNFQPDARDSYITVLGTRAQTAEKLDLSSIYADGVRAFTDMIENAEEPIPHHQLMFPVTVVNAIARSYQQNIEVDL
ncbi:MAG: hypothetical protein LBH54_02090 [Clostridiales bacterium]|jgi:hypothetical protein|nr:hypothetical protein [Clostridiales bacterium]